MNVTEAVDRRTSVRAFRPDSVSQQTVRDLLHQAARSPSGGNLQPWQMHALTGEPLKQLLDIARTRGPDPVPGYAIYPENLWEPYRTRRFENAEQLYGTIGIPRQDKAARLAQLAKNAEFFGAPIGIFAFIDRKMGPPQWSDLGMYLQTFMLLATERGLATCPQEYWALYSRSIESFLNIPHEQMLFCGVALGYADEDAPINRLRTNRAASDEWVAMHGF
jgi:nitroreductase